MNILTPELEKKAPLLSDEVYKIIEKNADEVLIPISSIIEILDMIFLVLKH